MNISYLDFEELEKELGWIPKQKRSYPEKCFVKVHFAFNFLFCLKSAFLLFVFPLCQRRPKVDSRTIFLVKWFWAFWYAEAVT